jgi:hypothetical protein
VINQEHPLASWFLIVAMAFFLVVYALPLLFVPLHWARWFQWELPQGKTDLAVYLGRCLGGVALSVIVIAYQGIADPKGHRNVFELIGMIGALLTLVHVWGAIRRIQPWTEHVEIALYAAVAVAAFWIRTTLA